MKLSFSLPSKSKPPKPNIPKPEPDNPTPPPEFLTEFTTSFQNPQTTPNNNNNIIIPPIQNEWRPSKKLKNLPLPPSSNTPLEFELDSQDSTVKPPEPDSSISYGLNLRHSSNEKSTDGNNDNTVEGILLRKLRSDMERLPEDEGFEQFEEVPVEGFGAALLKGYGWKEGRGIGRNAKEDVKVVEYTRRTAKEGLGFTLDHMPGPEREKEREERWRVGMEVRVVGGREAGVKGRVVEVGKGGEVVKVRLERGGEEARVRGEDLVEVGSEEEERCLRKLREMGIRDNGGREERKEERRVRDGAREERKEGKRGRDEGSRRESRRGKEKTGVREERWLRSHIRVRVVSEEFRGGRYYLKKGEVVDVVGPTTCDISMDEGREIVQGVEQDLLETALPRRGGPVLVLYGKHKGVFGSLVERDSEREIAVVQHADTKEMVRVRLEQVAEYAGDPSLLGY